VKARRMVTGLAAAVVAAGLVGVGRPTAQAAPSGPAVRDAVMVKAGNPSGTLRALLSVAGFQALVASVTEQVHTQYPDATLGDIVGSSPTGPTTSITDVTRWEFNFNHVTGEGGRVMVRGTVFLPDWTVTLTTFTNTVVYSRELTAPVAISPFKATLLLRTAGYREPFHTVIYSQPFGQTYPHPIFIVDQGPDWVQVDTVTRVVKPFHYSPGPTP
jgi:hypothetical protein